MNPLDDDCWILVFECLNLNERRDLRLTCKRFKVLCDQIQIDKLIVYQKVAPLAGHLQQTNEPYGLEHTAYVVSLANFFNDEQIVKQMKSIRALVIHGGITVADLGIEVELKSRFDQLNYLEIHRFNFHSPTILSSSKLEYLILDAVNMRPPELIAAKAKESMSSADVSVPWYALGLEELESKRLKHLTITAHIDRLLLWKAITSHRFCCLEDADLCLPDLTAIQDLAAKGNCPKLRKLNVMMHTEHFDQLVNKFGEIAFTKFFGTLSEEVTVYLYGLPFSVQHKPAFVDFLKPFAGKIQTALNSPLLTIRFDRQIYQHIKKWSKKQNLDQFCRVVGTILFESGEQLTLDKAIFKKFIQCRNIAFTANSNPVDFEVVLDALANLKMLLLNYKFDQGPLYGNQLLNLIGEKCPQLEDLVFDSWEKIDFGFLFKMQRLRHVKMLLAFAFPQCTLIDLLQKHRDLVQLDVYFVNSNSESKSELSAFKARVNETFAARFKARKLGFRVQIHTVSLKDRSKVNQFLRYELKEDCEPIARDEVDEMRMSNFIVHNAQK